MEDKVAEILEENRRRMARRAAEPPYDPVRGAEGDARRVAVLSGVPAEGRVYVPRDMTADPACAAAASDADAWQRLRCRYDFEYWCAVCCRIKDKITGRDIPFVLNRPQRWLAAVLEADRRAGRPLRLILLKARQWGGSTLVQTYMAWIQSCHCRNWHSIICSQVKDTSTGIRGMYTKLLENYPERLWDGDEPPRFRPYERSSNVREIAGRGCRVTVSSIENQDSVRGADFAMAHLTEVAFWRSTPSHTPADLVRAVCSSIALVPCSLIVMESTANGVGNYFHSEWKRCEAGAGDKRAVFVPWYEIDIYRLAPVDERALVESLTPYELELFHDRGCTLDSINWYRHKLREFPCHEKMMAEFPTTAAEAFTATGAGVFGTRHIERLRAGCREPERGEVSDDATAFVPDSAGRLSLWERPAAGASYTVTVDVGGRSLKSDWSVAAVMRTDTAVPEVVAQWRGHTDHDILALTAERLAMYYNEALLVVESNSLEGGAGASMYILAGLAGRYRNLYRRRAFDSVTHEESSRVGFHTNRQTKEMAVSALVAAVREGAYVERDTMACDELATYEQAPDGSYAARPGCHDDILMTRAIALSVSPRRAPAIDLPRLPQW